MNYKTLAIAGTCAGLIAGCSGEIDTSGTAAGVPAGSSIGGTAGAAGGPPIITLPDGVTAGPRPLRRLTRTEYENTVVELLGLSDDFASNLPDDARGPSGFTLAGPVGEVDAQRLQDAAERLAQQAIGEGLEELMGCDPEAGDELGCVRQFITSFGRRAFRRQLLDTEIEELAALFSNARTELEMPVPSAVGTVISAVLQAPQFLYLWERTTADDPAVTPLVPLSPHELASRLSYLMWRSMPDATLFAAVDAGSLQTPEDVAREARRLFADPRSHDTIAEFVKGWLHLPVRTNDDLGSSANGETDAFVKNVLGSDGLFATLLTSPVNMVNETLAPIYGASNVTGSQLREMVVDEEWRFGLLTQVNFLGNNADGAQSHPVKRGNIIYKQILCGELPEVPDDVPQPEPQQEGVPNRERFAAHSANACAIGCHGILDPLGFAFEHYDGTGRVRMTDGGQPVNASGDVRLPTGSAWSFNDAKDLVEQIAVSEEARSCATKQWLRYALTRHEVPEDEASITAAQAAFAAAGYDLRELFIAMTTTPSFLYRTAIAPGMAASGGSL